MKEKVCQFIHNYKAISNYKNTKEYIESAFMNGNCYWFAFILQNVFNGEICYLAIEGHFICKIEDEYYDINGCIDDSYGYRFDAVYKWKEYCEIEPLNSARIIRDSIYYGVEI